MNEELKQKAGEALVELFTDAAKLKDLAIEEEPVVMEHTEEQTNDG